jgi:APA family basic amino acid/polyamine antiporter
MSQYDRMSRVTGPSLARRLGTADAVVIGLGAMLGAGVFAALAPAAAAAGSLLLVGLAIAAVVATCNALSSAQLAALHPSSGGTYVYGRRQLGPFWGHLAGFGFVVGKTASCAAMALTVGAYAAPSFARPLAVASVLTLTAVNLRGVTGTARLTRVLVVIVLLVLLLVVLAGLLGGTVFTARLRATGGVGAYDVLQSAGLLFFAFAGYARIATLGEEVRDPERTIPRAIPLALGVVLAVYAAVAVTALLAVGPAGLVESSAPLATVVDAGSLSALTPAVRAGGAIAALGVLLSLLVGVSRTAFAMAREGELPHWLDAVHPVHRVPHHAELAVAAAVVTLVLVVDLRAAIGFSSFAVLVYYAVTNASALTLRADQRRYPPAIAGVGLLGCLLLAATLPPVSVLAGAAVLAVGAVVYAVRSRGLAG